MSTAEVQALTFDVFGTVVDWRSSVARELAALLGPRGGQQDWAAVADRWRALYQPAMAAVRSGHRPWVRLDDLHRENLAQVLAEFDLGGLDEGQLDHLNRAWHRLDPWPDVVAGLARLKRRFILATLSNGNVALMVNLARHAGLPWDAILGAEVAQAYKPLPAAYLRTADYLGLPPAACMMVAAHNNDLVTAGGLGFRTAFVARPQEYGPRRTRDSSAAHPFDVVASDFGDLADQLGC